MHSIDPGLTHSVFESSDIDSQGLDPGPVVALPEDVPQDPFVEIFENLMQIYSTDEISSKKDALADKQLLKFREEGRTVLDLSFFIDKKEEEFTEENSAFQGAKDRVQSIALHEIMTAPHQPIVRDVEEAFDCHDLQISNLFLDLASQGDFTPMEIRALRKGFAQNTDSLESRILFYTLKNKPEQIEKILKAEEIPQENILYHISFAKRRAEHSDVDCAEILELFQRYYPEEYEFEPEFSAFKLASLILNIPPTGFSVGPITASNLGHRSEIVLFQAKEMVSDFMKTPMASSLSKNFMIPLENLCDEDLTIQELHQTSEHTPVMLSTGWSGHSTYVVIYKNILILCNRGEGSGDTPGIRILSFDRDSLTASLMSSMAAKQDKRVFTERVERKLKAKQLLYIRQKPQTSGNCTWASMKSAIFGLIFLEKLQEMSDKKGSSFEEFSQEELQQLAGDSRGVYKGFTHFARVKAKEVVDKPSFPTPSVCSAPRYRWNKFMQLWKLPPLATT